MADQRYNRSIRLSAAKQEELLDRLEQSGADEADARRRGAGRVLYRADNIALTVAHPGGGVGRFLIRTRNLSAGGMSFIHGGFLHTGTQVRIALPALDGQMIRVAGEVVMCRYVASPVHEVGVTFHEKIDPTRFVLSEETDLAADEQSVAAPSLRGEILCIFEQEVESRLIAHQLRATGATPTITPHVGASIDWLKRQRFDLVIIDLDSPGGLEGVRAIRAAGHAGPIMVVGWQIPSDIVRHDPGGQISAIAKPYEAKELWSAVAGLVGADPNAGTEPIYSELESDPGAQELIGQFLGHVAQSLKQLSLAIDRGDIARARTLCHALAGTASGYGFPQLTEAGRAAVASLETTSSIPDSIHELRRVDSVARRLRARRPAA